MSDINNVREKIKKLLSLANSSNEHESKAAMLKAQSLMAQYKLSIKDFEEKESKIIQKVTDLYYTGYKNNYRNYMANNLSEFYCCTNCIQTTIGSSKRYLVLVGFEEDVKILEDIIKFADSCIYEWFGWYKYYNSYKYTNEYLNALKNSYGRGFTDGLVKLLKEQTEHIEQEWGLVMATPQEAKDFIKELNKADRIDMNVDFDKTSIYSEGVRDGYNADIQSKISS